YRTVVEYPIAVEIQAPYPCARNKNADFRHSRAIPIPCHGEVCGASLKRSRTIVNRARIPLAIAIVVQSPIPLLAAVAADHVNGDSSYPMANDWQISGLPKGAQA